MARAEFVDQVKHFNYFFLNDQLHKLIKAYRRNDIARCFNYVTEDFVAYRWSDIQSHGKHAYSLAEVCKILGLDKRTVLRYEAEGLVPPPSRSYRMGSPPTEELGGPVTARRYREEEIYELFEAMREKNRHGKVSRSPKTRQDLDQRLNKTRRALYFVDKSGKYRPLWRELDW
jgi:DNA-binding transcriptional MerR regulator